MRGGVVFFWAALATVILIAVGIFAMFVVSGRIVLFPEPTPEPTQLKDQLIAAGWVPDTVLAGQAGTDDFPETTVYYATDADYAAALGLANVIGGAAVAQSDIYQPTDDPATEVDEGATKQLTIVIGLDRTAAGAPTPEPTA